MSGVNKVILVGHLGKDPELRNTQGGTAVCNLRLATTERFKDREGQMQERTEWHSVVLWDRLAEVAGQHARKGTLCYIEGTLATRKWKDQSGQERYTTEIQVPRFGGVFNMLSKAEGGGGERPARSAGSAPGERRDATWQDEDPPF